MLSITQLRIWLAEWSAFWFAVGVCLLAGAAVSVAAFNYPCHSEITARIAGTTLQIIAIATAGAAITGARRQFGMPSIGSTVASWWTRRPWNVQNITLAVGAMTMKPLLGAARGHVWYNTDPSKTIDERLGDLEKQVEVLHTLWKQDTDATFSEFRSVREKLSKVAATALVRNQISESQLKQFAVGGVAVALAGLICALTGTLLAAASPDLSNLCKVTPNHSLKLSTNGMSHWPSGAGASPHFAPAVQRATPLSPA